MPTTYSWQSTLKEMDYAFSGIWIRVHPHFPGLIRTTNVATNRLPEKLGHLVEVDQRGYNASYLYTVGRNALRFSSSHCVLLNGFEGDEMAGCVGELI